VIPAGMQCCGMPCLGYGEMEQALKLARHNIDVFAAAGVETIITDCGTCGSCLKSYAHLLENDPKYAERAAEFSDKVRDISQFLVDRLNPRLELAEFKSKITYHESCHMHWVQEVSRQPRQLLGLIPGLELVEMKDAGACCGGAGSYNITHYATSMDILKRKMDNVAATGAELIATGCPGCRLQLRLGVKREGLSAQVVHPAELLEQAYGGK
jgi:glycolate oxidase iron-sulfur subunit